MAERDRVRAPPRGSGPSRRSALVAAAAAPGREGVAFRQALLADTANLGSRLDEIDAALDPRPASNPRRRWSTACCRTESRASG